MEEIHEARLENIQKDLKPGTVKEVKVNPRQNKKVFKGDVSGPLKFEHVSGFSNLGVSIDNFDVNHLVKQLQIINIQEKPRKENTEKMNVDGRSHSVNRNHFDKYTKELSDKDIEKNGNKDFPSSEKHESYLYSGIARNKTLNDLKVQYIAKENTKKEKEIVQNIPHMVDFKHIDGFSKLGVPLESFDINSYVEKELSLVQSSKSDSNVINDQKTFLANSKMSTKTQKVKKLNKGELSNPVNFNHLLGYSKDQGSDDEEWSDEEIPLSSESHVLEYEDNTSNVVKHNFPAGCQTFDKRTLEIDYHESLVQAITSDIKSPENKASLLIPHLTLKSKDLSQNCSEDDLTLVRGTTLQVQQMQEEEHHSDNLEDLNIFQQIRQCPVLKSVSACKNTKVYKTVDNKGTISSVNQMEKEKDKSDSPPHDENIVSPALKTAPANRNTKVSRTTETDSPAGPMAGVLRTRSQAFFPESSDSEKDES